MKVWLAGISERPKECAACGNLVLWGRTILDNRVAVNYSAKVTAVEDGRHRGTMWATCWVDGDELHEHSDQRCDADVAGDPRA